MDSTKIDRINTLHHKAQSVGLTEEEKKEQAELRKEYIDVFVVKRREHAQEVFDFGRSEIAHATPQSASGRTRSSRPAHSMMLR